MKVWPAGTQIRSLSVIAAGGLLVAGVAACGSSPSSAPASSQVAASAKQTIVFATQGLGSEGTATATAVKAFEKLHSNIKVQILSLSPTSDVAFEQLSQRFTAGSGTPDVITSDVIWPASSRSPAGSPIWPSSTRTPARISPARWPPDSTKAVSTRSRGSSTLRGCTTGPT